jgi:hypothetical protein
MGVSDGGSGSDVCLDSTPSGVRSAIAVTSVNDDTNRGDDVTAIAAYDCVVKIFYAATAMTDDAADAVADTAAERSPVATVNAAAASNANRSDNVAKNSPPSTPPPNAPPSPPSTPPPNAPPSPH